MRFDLNRDGWICWPEREDLSLEFMRLLAASHEGGSTVSECWLTASRIDFTDDDSWYDEWSKAADANNDRGFAAFAAGNLVTARSNWLRALNYYSAAAYPFDLAPDKQRAAVSAMRECAANYLRHRRPRGEVVSIPWLSEFALQGYYLPAHATKDPAPVVICIGEPGHRKEEYLFKLAPHAFERGISLLAVDVLGDGTGLPFEQLVRRQKLESAIEPVMDYLVGRDDVDDGRIAILGDGWSSSFVARGIAYDPRFAAAVCDGGIWDLHEQAFLKRRSGRARLAQDRSRDRAGRPTRSRPPRRHAENLRAGGDRRRPGPHRQSDAGERVHFRLDCLPAGSGVRQLRSPAARILKNPSASVFRNASEIDGDFQTGFLQPFFERGQFAGQLVDFAGAEFRENEFVQAFLLRRQACQVLVGLVRQRHFDDPGVFARGLAADEALFLEKLRLRRDERRIDVQHLRNGVDRCAVALVEIRQRHDHHPLRTADTEGLGPEVPKFLQMYADRGDFPGESPNDILILLGGLIHWAPYSGSRHPITDVRRKRHE